MSNTEFIPLTRSLNTVEVSILEMENKERIEKEENGHFFRICKNLVKSIKREKDDEIVYENYLLKELSILWTVDFDQIDTFLYWMSQSEFDEDEKKIIMDLLENMIPETETYYE
jgi:hypothetical protein